MAEEKREIHGNTAGVRRSVLEELKALYAFEIDEDVFLPQALCKALAAYSSALNREIALYITRDGEIVDIIIGTHQDVELRDYRLRRNAQRLSCVRCVHTHPNASGRLSDVDLSALRAFRYDAMAAIGVRDGRPCDMQAAFLVTAVNAVPQILCTETLLCERLPQEEWMQQIEASDRAVRAEEDVQRGKECERAVLMGIESEASLAELKRLAETAGAEVIASYLQRRERSDGALLIGRGRAEELARQCQALEADMCIFDEELTGIQARSLEDILRVKVVDRTTLILDIFAQRASSREGKLQVELAQLTYQSARLVGEGTSLSRLAGGIGARGPGESRLEMNRRRIRARMTDLRRELELLEKQRETRKKTRRRRKIPVVALVGYTNAGKSTLLNRFCDADAYVQDQLFATLDAMSRRAEAAPGTPFLLADTVGFIRKLPHALVSAFRGTLEEAAQADVLVIVSDGASDAMDVQHQVVEEVLAELGATEQPRIEVVNKCDRISGARTMPGAIYLSAKTGEGIEKLRAAIARELRAAHAPVTLRVPFSEYAILGQVRPLGQVLKETYTETGAELTLLLSPADRDRLLSRYGAGIFAATPAAY